MSKNKMSVSHSFSVSLCQKMPSDGLKRVETSSAGKCDSEKHKLSAVGIIFKNVAHRLHGTIVCFMLFNVLIRSEVGKSITMRENFTSWNVCQNVVFLFFFLTLPFCEAVRFKKGSIRFLNFHLFLPKSVTRWQKAAWCEVLSFSFSGEAASTDLCEFATLSFLHLGGFQRSRRQDFPLCTTADKDSGRRLKKNRHWRCFWLDGYFLNWI